MIKSKPQVFVFAQKICISEWERLCNTCASFNWFFLKSYVQQQWILETFSFGQIKMCRLCTTCILLFNLICNRGCFSVNFRPRVWRFLIWKWVWRVVEIFIEDGGCSNLKLPKFWEGSFSCRRQRKSQDWILRSLRMLGIRFECLIWVSFCHLNLNVCNLLL